MKPRRTPRRRVACHLMDLGYKLHEDDIHFVHGGAHKRLSDILECWSVFCLDKDDKQVELMSGYTLTECAQGIEVIPNTRDSDLYGDFLVRPKKKAKV